MQGSFMFGGKVDHIPLVLHVKGVDYELFISFPHSNLASELDIKMIMMMILFSFLGYELISSSTN